MDLGLKKEKKGCSFIYLFIFTISQVISQFLLSV